MGRLTGFAGAVGAVWLAGALGGCVTIPSAPSASSSYEPAPDSRLAARLAARRIAEDLALTLSQAFPPAKTTLAVRPAPYSMHDTLRSVFASHAPAPERFEETLSHVLRSRGYALAAPAAPAAGTSQPLVYILDRLGNDRYYAGLCVGPAWCVHRLYRRDPGGPSTVAGGSIYRRLPS